MAYDAPSAATFKARFTPVFDAVPDLTVEGALTRAARLVDASWPEGDFAEARMLAAAHDLTTEGLGTSPEAQAMNAGGQIKRQEAAGHKIEFFAPASGADIGSDVPAEFAGSRYGAKFYALLRRVKGGPLTVAAAGYPCSGAAYDCEPGGFNWRFR